MKIVKIIKTIITLLKPAPKTFANIITLAPNEFLKERTALITGGSSGIGFEIARAYINAGAKVVITGRNEEKLAKACNELNKNYTGQKCWSVVLDNTKTDSFKSKFDEILKLLGGDKIDILVNNAGVLGCHISNGTEEEYDEVLDTNLKGVFFLTQIVAHYMKDNSIKGNILNIASSSSLRPAVSAYTISKWGIRGFTQGMAKALAPYGITVNGLAPGQTATPMLKRNSEGNIYIDSNPIQRLALPEEIANMAVILVSDMGRMIVGDIVYMTGGSGLISNEDMNYNF